MLDCGLRRLHLVRLFREVREKRGLAYAVGSYNEQYVDSG
jgi:predicted Zn-dependent peptidase